MSTRKKESNEEKEESFGKVYYDTLINKNLIFKKREICIILLNKRGDAEITSNDCLLNVGSTSLDCFEVFHASLSSEMEIEKMNYKVTSGTTTLKSDLLLNLPTEKKIIISFKEPLKFQEETTIKEEFRWDGMFPSTEREYYFVDLIRPVWELKFSLKYPHDMEVEQFWIDRILRLSGEKERLPEIEWNKSDRVINTKIIPDILCYYKYSWEY